MLISQIYNLCIKRNRHHRASTTLKSPRPMLARPLFKLFELMKDKCMYSFDVRL